MECQSLSDARKEDLIQLTVWCRHCDLEERYIEKEIRRIMLNKERKTMVVKYGGHIALFVDDIAEKERKIKF